MLRSFSFLLLAVFLCGCGTTNRQSSSNVTGATDVASLGTYRYAETIISGMEWREANELLLKERSGAVLSDRLSSLGFAEAGTDSDFYIVAKWRKAVSSYPSTFRSIDGPSKSLQRRKDPTFRFASRVNLTVEIYEASTDELIWVQDLPDIFDSVQFTEKRVVASLERAVKRFPEQAGKSL